MKYTLFFTFCSILLLGCGSAKNVTKTQLANDKWILKTINNRDANLVFADKIPFILFNFEIEQVSGNAGCNSFSGKLTYTAGKLKVPNPAVTQMACMGNNEESTFIELLGKESKLSLMNGDLIFSQDNKPVLVFSREKPLTSTDLIGTWKLQSLEGASANSDFKDKIPTIVFESSSGKISGKAGCNSYNSTFTLAKNVIDISPLITTRMTCEVINGENKFVELLPGRSEIDIVNGVLTLRRDNIIIMTFKR